MKINFEPLMTEKVVWKVRSLKSPGFANEFIRCCRSIAGSQCTKQQGFFQHVELARILPRSNQYFHQTIDSIASKSLK